MDGGGATTDAYLKGQILRVPVPILRAASLPA
jgi:hypothetical protein